MPKQRMLLNLQANRTIAFDNDEPSDESDYENKDARAIVEDRRKELLEWSFTSSIDRKMILGLLSRQYDDIRYKDAKARVKDDDLDETNIKSNYSLVRAKTQKQKPSGLK